MATSRSSLSTAINGLVPQQAAPSDSERRLQAVPTAVATRKIGVVPRVNLWLEQMHGRPADLGAASLEALDLLNLGVALINSARVLLLANRTAEQLLASRDGLEVTSQGVLTSLKRCCNPPLSGVIQQVIQATKSGTASGKDAVLALQRPSGKRPLTLLVRPVHGRTGEGDADPTVLVFMLDPELPVPATVAGLRQLFGLTSSEARLAHILMSGKTVEDCCALLDIRPSTARMHLGNLFAKTGVQRQGQLISLLLKSVGMVRDTAAERPEGQAQASGNGLNAGQAREGGPAVNALGAGLEALDLINVGVGVTNGLGQLLFANHTAQEILATRDGLEVTTGGMLATLKKCCSPPLAALVQQASQGGLGRGSAGGATVLSVRRPSGKRPLTLLVRRLAGKSAQAHLTAPAVLIFILDPEIPVATTDLGLRQLYGFTSTEARLAGLLMEGNGLDHCCEQLEIRPSTARMHLGNVFAKTGVQRQGQLISLLLKSVGMIRVRSDEASLKLMTSRYGLSDLLGQQDLRIR